MKASRDGMEHRRKDWCLASEALHDALIESMRLAGSLEWPLICGLTVFAILLRLCIGLHGYSGQGISPRYGDYEAQRHWMELTVNLPAKDWYQDSADNDLTYWGLDYPPLSAFQSWLCGKVVNLVEPEAVELHISRGYESATSKLLMRWTVVAFDLIVFIPCTFAVCKSTPRLSSKKRLWSVGLPLVASLLQPAALLIDHGHFQYNNIGLGLSAGAAAAVMTGRQLLGSSLFCLALNHKQMTLYYAPAFFAHLLGRCLQKPSWTRKVVGVAKLGAVVIATFALVWAAWLTSAGSLLGVLQRLAPLRRGLFEDYVANFWCVSSLFVKWKRLFAQQDLVRLTTLATLSALAPGMVQQIRRPSSLGLLYGMSTSALAFFLFSYQVHEKSILLPLMPILLLAEQEPFLAGWMPIVSAFSMFPLLKKDGVAIAYAGCVLLWISIASDARFSLAPQTKGFVKRLVSMAVGGTVAAGAAVHLISSLLSPPQKLPFLFDAMFVSLAFVHIVACFLYLNYRQWTQP